MAQVIILKPEQHPSSVTVRLCDPGKIDSFFCQFPERSPEPWFLPTQVPMYFSHPVQASVLKATSFLPTLISTTPAWLHASWHHHFLTPRAMLSCSVVSSSLQPHGLQPARLLYPWNSPGKNTGINSHSLLQGIFPTQGLSSGLPHGRQILYI